MPRGALPEMPRRPVPAVATPYRLGRRRHVAAVPAARWANQHAGTSVGTAAQARPRRLTPAAGRSAAAHASAATAVQRSADQQATARRVLHRHRGLHPAGARATSADGAALSAGQQRRVLLPEARGARPAARTARVRGSGRAAALDLSRRSRGTHGAGADEHRRTARVGLHRADRLVIDLDPGEGVPWPQVRQAAVEVRERLAAQRLRSFVRTTGGKGLHVVLPLSPPASWDAAHSFAGALAETMAREQPQRYLAAAARQKRAGRIFLDYLRNARGATAVCSYSLRRRAGAPVATPLSWEELAQLRAPDQFRFANIRRRLARLSADPWAGIGSVRQCLPPP